ncbi:hypothetical protein ACFX2I_028048 [Malus domestica]
MQKNRKTHQRNLQHERLKPRPHQLPEIQSRKADPEVKEQKTHYSKEHPKSCSHQSKEQRKPARRSNPRATVPTGAHRWKEVVGTPEQELYSPSQRIAEVCWKY